jgi:hypothetical protein
VTWHNPTAVAILQSVWVEGRTLTFEQARLLETHGRGETSFEQALDWANIGVPPALLSCEGGPQALVKALYRSMPKTTTNQEGLTFEEWYQAAGGTSKMSAELAWSAGYDPTEFCATREAALRA